MPCYDHEYEELRTQRYKEKDQAEAILCGIFTAYGVQILDKVNFKEVGVTRKEAVRWWINHQIKDSKRG